MEIQRKQDKDSEKRLGIIIINYKTPHLIIDCLHSLINEIDRKLDKVIVVDNASNDNSIEQIELEILKNKWEDIVQVIPSIINGGFSAGNNIGIRSINAEYYLLLNSDTVVRTGAIALLLNTMRHDPTIGIVGPLLEFLDGTPQISCFHFTSPSCELLRSAKTKVITRLFGLLNIYEEAIPEFNHLIKPDWVGFPAVLIRQSLINQVGFMDEGYFMYSEDMDYCRQAKNKGWNISYLPGARIVHLNKGASNYQTKRLPAYIYESRSRYFAKFYGQRGLLLANLFWMLGRAISYTRELVGNKKPHLPKLSSRDIWTNFFSPMSSTNCIHRLPVSVKKPEKEQ